VKTVAFKHPSVELPRARFATEPPEARGLERDGVRLMVAGPDSLEHAVFASLADRLEPGDLVVVNTSATLPAAVDSSRNGEPIVVHFSAALDDGSWVVELRSADESGPLLDAVVGEGFQLEGGARLRVLSSYGGRGARNRMLRANLVAGGAAMDYLARAGRPISYSYMRSRWPLDMYQTVFAREPGSAEMPSAGRPFSTRLVTELVTRGVLLAPIVLHAGVSSLEKNELPLPERFLVPATTARLVNETRAAGRRVVAVGTTVTRALEAAARPGGRVVAAAGWTDLVLSVRRPARVVDCLITGWHLPDSSHVSLLEAVVGTELVARAYRSALAESYLWHEFGDSCLLQSR
jgi:S-adenosylmethionine:tRNA ribosyltransferase-isomerase